MTTEERFTVQWDLNVGWVRNRFTYQHQARHGRLLVATVSLITARVVHTDVPGAVQYLWDSYISEETRLFSLKPHRLHFHQHPLREFSPPHLSTLCYQQQEPSSPFHLIVKAQPGLFLMLRRLQSVRWLPTPSSLVFAEATLEVSAFLSVVLLLKLH